LLLPISSARVAAICDFDSAFAIGVIGLEPLSGIKSTSWRDCQEKNRGFSKKLRRKRSLHRFFTRIS
jgi:hypothetical protein